MKHEFYHSSDYAGLKTPNFQFYYGYEVEENGEWCFQVKNEFKEVVVTIPHSQLECDQFNVLGCLVIGMGKFIGISSDIFKEIKG